MKNIMLFLMALVMSCHVMAQQNRITGTVTDKKDGLGMPGVNVLVKGTTSGTITDMNGNFSLNFSGKDAVLVVSCVGYKSVELRVKGDQKSVNVVIEENSELLDEVVVVGYGVQKKKLVTGATVQVSGNDLQKLSTTSALTALQSQTPGVNITQSSGQPGDGFKVTVRGLGTIGSSSPLYVIDGVAGGSIDNLNPSDIESIDVLKDAASAAIYGARAANGVILVTTKQGKSGKVTVSYDGYYGSQYAYKMPDLLTAKEYMAVQDMINFNEGNPGNNWSALLPSALKQSIEDGTWNGTNWMKESYNKAAPVQNHAINLTGGGEASKFSLGFSYASQEGIFGKPVESNYGRYTARVNSDHVLLKVRDFDAIKIGETLNYSYSTKSGVSTGNIYSNSIHSLLTANPLMPLYDENGDYYDYYAKQRNGWNYDASAANPIANTALSSQGLNLSKSHNLQASAYVQIQPIKNLIFKSQFGYKMSANTYRSYDRIKKLSSTNETTTESVSQNAGLGASWTLDNTLAYKFTLNEHTFDMMVGQSAERWGLGDNVSASGKNTLFLGSWKNAYVDNTKPTALDQITAGSSPWGEGTLASFFGRVNYDYKEKYMASFTLRADGSSNFAKGHQWGYFPSVSAGWVVSSEPFMESTKNWMDFLKVRGSWGQNGNCNISGYQYLTTFAFDVTNGYYFGKDKSSQTTGGYANILKNPDVTWETSEQLDLGFDARFFDTRLGVAFDWYKKTTKDWLVVAPILSTYGLNAPYINGGDVENQGFELALNWNDKIGKDFNYGVNLNISKNKNKVTRIANSEGIIHGDANVLSQGTDEMYRAQVGMPIGYFYGYKTDGIFQNYDQIAEYKAAGKGVLAGAQPGDVIFTDYNKDGVIDDNDRTMIGDPHPDYTLGLGINLSYKGFDLNIAASGSFGQQIAKSYRSFADTKTQNFTTDIFGAWTGEGTSNKLPRLTSGSHTNWQKISDIYIEDGDYLKIQNVTIGYDFKKLFTKLPLQQARLFITAQNLYTFTGYSGMDPEIGYGYDKSWVSGIDLGFYPSPRTFLVGVNLKF